jgi:hypothetical protein
MVEIVFHPRSKPSSFSHRFSLMAFRGSRCSNRLTKGNAFAVSLRDSSTPRQSDETLSCETEKALPKNILEKPS